LKLTESAKSRSRVASGVAAHLYSQMITIVTQLANVPIFLHRWDADTYGKWLAISAVPVYLTMVDAGILTAAGNLMSMHHARGEDGQLKKVFKAGLGVVTLVLPTVGVLIGGLLLAFSFGLNADQRGALFALAVACLFTVASGLFDAAYRSVGKYPKIAFLLSTARIVEWAAMLMGLFIGGTLTSTALGFLIGRVLSFTTNFFLSRRDVPQIEWSLVGIDRQLAASLARSGVGFISITFGSVLTLQGMVVLAATQLGGTAVAVFSTSRTLTRLLAQVAVLSGKSMAPEISALHGSKQQAAADKLIRQMTGLVMSVILIGAAILVPIGPTVMKIWSHGEIQFNRTVFYLLVAAAIATSFWQIQSVRLTATNQHRLFASMFVGVAVIALVATYFGMARFGVAAPAAGTLLADLLMIGVTFVALRWSAPVGELWPQVEREDLAEK
jgi:O-antigen/teichoic acid export membrane protein